MDESSATPFPTMGVLTSSEEMQLPTAPSPDPFAKYSRTPSEVERYQNLKHDHEVLCEKHDALKKELVELQEKYESVCSDNDSLIEKFNGLQEEKSKVVGLLGGDKGNVPLYALVALVVDRLRKAEKKLECISFIVEK